MLTSRKQFLQQTGFALIGSFIPFSKLLATSRSSLTVDINHPMDCTKDLRNVFYTDPSYIKESDFMYHKGTYPGIIKDVLYEEEEDIPCIDPASISDPPIKRCDPTDHHSYPDDPASDNISILRYHTFYPLSTYEDSVNGHDYENYPLPCVAVFHPGGFQECPDYLQPGVKTVCKQLAARGYIAITIDYRAGRILDQLDTQRTSVQRQIASYRGIQDARGAIRTIIKKNSTNHGGKFTINENQFFVGGMSAGAVIATSIAYYRSQAMINLAFPVPSTSINIEAALGHMNADYYEGETGSDLDNPLYWPTIRGVLSCWGGITIPWSFDGNTFPGDISDEGVSEKVFFQASSGPGNKINPPMIGFGGANDIVIPFNDKAYQNIWNSKKPKYRSENFCFEPPGGDFILKNGGSATAPIYYTKLCSVKNMYNVLRELNRYTELYTDCNMEHGINDIATDNFGVNATSKNDVFTYIAIRAAVFFQTIMNGPTNGNFLPFGYTGKSFFVSSSDTAHITNQRICPECDPDHSCTFTNDPECP